MSTPQTEQTGQPLATSEFDPGDFASLLHKEFKPNHQCVTRPALAATDVALAW